MNILRPNAFYIVFLITLVNLPFPSSSNGAPDTINGDEPLETNRLYQPTCPSLSKSFKAIYHYPVFMTTDGDETKDLVSLKGTINVRIVKEGNAADGGPDWNSKVQWIEIDGSVLSLTMVLLGGAKEGKADVVGEIVFNCWDIDDAATSICESLANLGDEACGTLRRTLRDFVGDKCRKGTEYQGKTKTPEDVPEDYERWWVEGPRRRSTSYMVAVHRGDDAGRLAKLLCAHIHVEGCDREMEERLRKDYVGDAGKDGPPTMVDGETGLPYSFTVLGDSHTGTWDWVSLKVSNPVNVTGVAGASIYGLPKVNSTTGSGRVFEDVMRERGGREGAGGGGRLRCLFST